MLQRMFIAVLLIALPAAAQTSPCSGGATNPLFTVTGRDPVVLRFEHAVSHRLGGPQVMVNGTTIGILQYLLDAPPPPSAAEAPCNAQTVSLGALPPGTYQVRWSYAIPPALPNGSPQLVETYPFTFTVAASCTMPPPVFFLRMTLRPGSAGARRLHYENSFLGYTPQFGTPAVSVFEHSINIVQPVMDVAPSGSASENIVCNAEDVDLPPLAPGIYGVQVMHVFPNSEARGALVTGIGGFIIGPNGDVQCTTTRSFSLLPPAVPGSPITLKSTIMTTGFYSGTDLLFRNGFTFYVLDRIAQEYPTTYVPYCLISAIDLGKMPAGAYAVQWGTNDFGASRPGELGTFSFNVAMPARHRPSGK